MVLAEEAAAFALVAFFFSSGSTRLVDGDPARDSALGLLAKLVGVAAVWRQERDSVTGLAHRFARHGMQVEW